MSESVFIVGAGLSGLTAARELVGQGYDVIVADRGRTVGGRLATRSFEDAVFDHGAQFFTVREPRFADQLAAWQSRGIADVWFKGYPSPEDAKPEDHYPRFNGIPGMTALAKSLAQGLDVRLSERISSVTHADGRWTAHSDVGPSFEADWLLLTPPVKQSLELLADGGTTLPAPVQQTLESLRYEPCFALMVLLEDESRIPPPGALYLNDPVISWIADNHQKGISPVAGAVTIHATGTWTRQHYETDRDRVAATLLEAAHEYLGSAVKTWQLHRWRYSKPENPLEIGALAVPEMKLVFAGDALNGAKVEGATLSGVKAAELIMKAKVKR